MFTGLTLLAVASAATARPGGRKVGHSLLSVVGVWSLIAALLFSGTLLTWLVFADAIALGVIALADLTAHEVSTGNVVHRLEVSEVPAGRLAA